MVLYNPAPGQEKENALLFESKDLARIAHNKEELLMIIDSLISNLFFRKRMVRKLKEYQKPNATETIVKHVVNTLEIESSVMRIKS